MAKYYLILVLILGAVLVYIFLEDPCNNQFRADFSNKHPGYKILDSASREGSPEIVQCEILYKKPDNDQIYKDIWVYEKLQNGWSFSSVLEAEKTAQMP